MKSWLLPSVAAGISVAAALMLSRHAPPAPPSPSVPVGPHGRVNVTVYDDGEPLAGREVVFQDAAGRVVAQATSGQDGKASADVPVDGMVTVAYGTSIQQLITVMGVQPGDDIIVGEAEDEGGAARVVSTARVKLPGARAGASRYTVSLGVGSTEVPRVADALPVPVPRRFLVDARRFPVLGEAWGANDAPLAYAFDWGNVPRSAMLDAGAARTAPAAVDVRLGAWSDAFRDLRFTLTAPLEGLTSVDGQVFILANERDRFERPRKAAPIADATQLRFAIPRPLEGDVVYRLEFSYGAASDKSVLARSDKAIPDAIGIDLGEALLPRVSSATVDAGEGKARPKVHYRVAGDASRADAAVVRIAWPETREHVWTIFTPPSAGSELPLPELPPSLKDWRPDGRPMSAAVALIEASFYDGYDDVRHKGLAELSEDPESGEPRTWRYSATGDISF